MELKKGDLGYESAKPEGQVGTYTPVVMGEGKLCILDTRSGAVWNYCGSGKWELEVQGPQPGRP